MKARWAPPANMLLAPPIAGGNLSQETERLTLRSAQSGGSSGREQTVDHHMSGLLGVCGIERRHRQPSKICRKLGGYVVVGE